MSSSSPPDTGGTGDSEVRRRKTRSQAKAEGREEPKPENETGAEKQEVETVPLTPTQEVTTQSEQGRAPPEQQYFQPQPIYQEVLVVPPNRIIFAIPKWIVYTLTVVFGILFIALGGYVGDVVYKKYFYAVPTMPNMTFSAVGNEGWEFFKKFDRDDDLRLSLDEYETLYHALVSSGINVTTDLVDKNHYTIGKNEKTITVQAYFQPLLLETMNSDLNDTSENLDSLKGLQSWKKVNTEQMDLGVKQFYGFLPPNQTFLDKLGEVYVIYGQNSTSLPDIPSHRSSNKYIPPRVEDEIVVIHQLLTMFHPRPFLRTRFPPQGATACVRAVNDEYIDISFRIHAEFQLSDPPYNPMWFTPGQFTGNFIITRDYSKIIYFHMYVPTDKKLNVDMEWMTDIQMAASMQVDIGFMPQMEVKTVDKPSSNEIKEPSMKWKKEITEAEARRKLEIKMYPFKQVPYYNFTDSFEIAQKENKLVHSILLWGALDDQSC